MYVCMHTHEKLRLWGFNEKVFIVSVLGSIKIHKKNLFLDKAKARARRKPGKKHVSVACSIVATGNARTHFARRRTHTHTHACMLAYISLIPIKGPLGQLKAPNS